MEHVDEEEMSTDAAEGPKEESDHDLAVLHQRERDTNTNKS